MATVDILNAEYLAVLRGSAPEPSTADVAAQIDAGTYTDAEYINLLISIAQASTIPALAVIPFGVNLPEVVAGLSPSAAAPGSAS